MQNQTVLQEDKTYNHQETAELLEEVRDFFQGNLKMIGIEWISEQRMNQNQNNDSELTKLFVIGKGKRAFYEQCSSIKDVENVLNQFADSLNYLLENLDALLDHNLDLNREHKDNLESYAKAVDKSIRVFANQRRMRSAKLKELLTVEELQEELKDLLGEIISKYIISVLMDPLYGRIKNQDGEIYKLVVNEINIFLSANGVYTKEVMVGEPIDPEFVEPTSDSIDHVTDDFEKFDTIDEIRRYPYLFYDGTKIKDGSAKIWRRKD